MRDWNSKTAVSALLWLHPQLILKLLLMRFADLLCMLQLPLQLLPALSSCSACQQTPFTFASLHVPTGLGSDAAKQASTAG